MQNVQIETKERQILGTGNLKLRLRSTSIPEAVGTIVIVHGVGEHLGRYQHLDQWLLSIGYNCFLYDHRGFGLSQGIPGDVISFHNYAEDLALVNEMALAENPNLPIYVFGHSMGSLVVLLNLILYPGRWKAAIVTGVPLKIAVPIPKWQEVLGQLAVKLWPTFRVSAEIDPSYLSHDADVVKAYQTDDLVQHKVTVRWGLAFIAAVKEVEVGLNKITEKLLILHGGDDHVSAVAGARLLAETLGNEQTTLIVYPGLFHELHSECETDRNRVFKDIQTWLTSQLRTENRQG